MFGLPSLTGILIIVALAGSVTGLAGIKGCMAERDKRIASESDNKRLRAEIVMRDNIIKGQKGVEKRVQEEKNRLDSLSGAALDAELDRLLNADTPKTKSGGPGPK